MLKQTPRVLRGVCGSFIGNCNLCGICYFLRNGILCRRCILCRFHNSRCTDGFRCKCNFRRRCIRGFCISGYYSSWFSPLLKMNFFFYLVWDFEFVKLLPKLNIQLCLNIILRPVPWDLPLCGLWLRVYLLFFAAEFDLLPLILVCRRCCALDDAKMNVPPV